MGYEQGNLVAYTLYLCQSGAYFYLGTRSCTCRSRVYSGRYLGPFMRVSL